MKSGFLLYLVMTLSLTAASAQTILRAQDSTTHFDWNGLIRRSQIPVRAQDARVLFSKKGTLISLAVLQHPAALAKQLNLRPRTDPGTKPLLDPGTCQDSSGNKLIGLTNQLIFLISTTHTRDDAELITGTITDTSITNWGQVYNAFLMKVDNRGNVLWLTMFGDGGHDLYSNTEFNLVAELQSGDIVVAGQCFNTTSKQIGSELLARYDASGNLRWNKTYSSLIAQNAQFSPVDFRSVTDGLNGDLIVCGTVMSNAGANLTFTTMRMSGDGNLIWDVNYHHPGASGLGSEGLGAKVIAGSIVTVGLDHGSSTLKIPSAVELLTLNYATGSLSGRRLFATDYSDPVAYLSKQFTYFYNHCAFQNNGHIIVYGALYSDLSHITTLVDHFGVMEFDAALNLVDAYSVSSYIRDNSPAAVMHFDGKGRGIFLIESNYPGLIAKSFLGVLQRHQLASQRFKIYNDVSVNNTGGFGENVRTITFNDGSYMLAQNLIESATAQSKSYINIRKMHLSDTSSVCMGTDSVFSLLLPLNVIEKQYSQGYVNEVFTSQMTRTGFNLVRLDAPGTVVINGCGQTNYCDTLKLHGDTVFCSGAGPQVFSAFKNAACGAIVQWQLDSNYIQADSILSDSSIRLSFKNVNGLTGIRVSLPPGTCSFTRSDSLIIRIAASPEAPAFGPDTSLCGGNKILLKTAPGFLSYLWQDGSTSPDFTVTAAGTYHVAVVDICGNVLKDTIAVSDAQTVFSAGADTVKCNTDSVILQATPGYTRYTWTPDYNISSQLTPQPLVSPDVTTIYTVKAERGTNCVVSRSVRVGVLHSGTINLGPDSSLCAGTPLLLDAGPGFMTYQWSTGATTENISVTSAGAFVVKATAANGCVSKGLKNITGVYPLPVFHLADAQDTSLCEGQTLAYRFALPSAGYVWSDGSTGAAKDIVTAGAYALTVTENGCAVTRSVMVNFRPLPDADLGNDLFLCAGATKLLNANSGGDVYRWQDGSTGPAFLVTRSGRYSVAVSLDGCTSEDTVAVTYLDKPNISFPKDTMLCPGEMMLLDPRLTTQAAFLWQDGSTDSVYPAPATGTYSLTVSNICGSDVRSVRVIPGVCELLLPNAFTPNHDGRNDVFKIRYPFPVQAFKMKIFSRYGQLLFETTDMSRGWDGAFGSQDQPQGGYTWSIETIELTGEHRSSTGVVLLLR